MLPEVAAEVLHFLTRRDLDKACGISKWLDAMIAHCFEVYPLRRVRTVKLFPCGKYFTLQVWGASYWNTELDHSFSSWDEALRFTAFVLRHSYVLNLEFGECDWGVVTFLSDQWNIVVDAIRYGAIRRLKFECVDFSALDDGALLETVACRGLQSFVVRRSVVPSGFVTDDLIQFSVANDVFRLWIFKNESEIPRRLSEDALMGLYFSAESAPRRRTLLALDGSWVTDMFLTKFFERLLSSTLRRFGSMKFYGAAKQRGLSAYANYLVPSSKVWVQAAYLFPATEVEDKFYRVALCERSSYLYVWFCLVGRSS